VTESLLLALAIGIVFISGALTGWRGRGVANVADAPRRADDDRSSLSDTVLALHLRNQQLRSAAESAQLRAAALEDEVEGLADRFGLIDPDLLSANKRITNLALELMGAQTLQRLAGENDARAHRAQAVRDYGRSVREHGLKETLRRRDEPFGEGYARVGAPEGRRRTGHPSGD